MQKLFSFKSRETREKEQREYNLRAFPFGEMQRNKLKELLLEIFPKERSEISLFGFLTCKEYYHDLRERDGEVSLAELSKVLNKKQNVIKKNVLHIYIAVLLADASVGTSLNYPTAEEIIAHAEQIKQQIN